MFSGLLLHDIWHLLIIVVQSTGVKNIPENLGVGELWQHLGCYLLASNLNSMALGALG